MEGWMGGWMGGKAGLRIAFSNQKFENPGQARLGPRISCTNNGCSRSLNRQGASNFMILMPDTGWGGGCLMLWEVGP